MKTNRWLRAAVLPALFAAGTAFAQTKSPTATDTAPTPAEERSSAGAIVFEDSMPRAHQQAFGVRDSRAEVAAIGQGVMTATMAQMNEPEGPNTRALGGPPAPDVKAKAKPKAKHKKVSPSPENQR